MGTLVLALIWTAALSMTGCTLIERDNTDRGPSVVGPDSGDSAAPFDTAWNQTPYYPSSFAELPDPCADIGPIYSLYFPRDGEGWVGCGNGAGLHRSQDDGASFEEILPGNQLYVFDVREDREGRLMVCGHAYAGKREGALLIRQDDEETWTDLLYYGKNSDQDNAVYISNCGQVAQDSFGRLMVFSNTIGDLTTSSNNGRTWTKEERYWEDDNLEEGGYAAHQVMRLESTTEGFVGSGSNIAEPPMFFKPSTHPDAEFWNMNRVEISNRHIGEAWAMASPDDGESWVLGGRDQEIGASASGFLFVGQEQSWTSIPLGPEIDIVRDVDFSGDGQLGLAVGDRYPPTSKGGFVLVTLDGGRTWMEMDVDIPADLQRVELNGDKFWIGGNGFFAGGQL